MPKIIEILADIVITTCPVKLTVPTFFIINIFSLVFIPIESPYSLAMPQPILKVPLEHRPINPPNILPKSIRPAIHISPNIAIPIFKTLLALAMLGPSLDLALIPTHVGLNDPLALRHIRPPLPHVLLLGRLPLAVSVLLPGQELTGVVLVLEVVVAAAAFGFVVNVHAEVDAGWEGLVANPVFAAVLELPFVETVFAADH